MIIFLVVIPANPVYSVYGFGILIQPLFRKGLDRYF